MSADGKSSVEQADPFGSVPLAIVVRAGVAHRTLHELLRLKQGDVIELDRRIGEPFDLLVEGLRVACVTPVACEEQVTIKLVRVSETTR